jgi:asparagine synthase (glutamine-hydrolysing)
VANKYNTEHHDIVVHPNSLELIQKLARHYDEPFADSSAIPTYIVSDFAVKHVKVALSGDGGDEFFAGYDVIGDMQRYEFVDRIPRPLRKLISWTADGLPYFAYGKNCCTWWVRPRSSIGISTPTIRCTFCVSAC